MKLYFAQTSDHSISEIEGVEQIGATTRIRHKGFIRNKRTETITFCYCATKKAAMTWINCKIDNEIKQLQERIEKLEKIKMNKKFKRWN